MAAVDAAFCVALPKVELHAHLNGSLDVEGMEMLRDMKKDRQPELLDFDLPQIDPSFRIEEWAGGNLGSRFHIAFVTRRVIEAFRNDGVRYLELRTTPRRDGQTGMTKRSYIEAVLMEMDAMSESYADIVVKLILSMDRRHTLEECLETVELALELRDRGIVGIDVCGDPTKGSFSAIRPAVSRAKDAGLKVTIHLGEVPDTDAESSTMLDCLPDRLGHATYLSADLRERILRQNIPIEMCMTSNVLCKTVATYEDHHIRDFFPDHPCALCTDDMGIFRCKLSDEYAVAAWVFSMDRRQLFELSRMSIDCIFAGDAVKERLRREWEEFAASALC
ncbi:hypothetical protein DFJ74DRAFT_699837 [Hyaloraphidium curvatum]|nr:hypothetical protein DFJ74DRAFT_699837 [Hyaloraphidium curvatum]